MAWPSLQREFQVCGIPTDKVLSFIFSPITLLWVMEAGEGPPLKLSKARPDLGRVGSSSDTLVPAHIGNLELSPEIYQQVLSLLTDNDSPRSQAEILLISATQSPLTRFAGD